MEDGAWAIYARVLSSLSVEEINAAMVKLMQTVKFFPTIAEIFEAAKSVKDQAQGNTVPTAADAWGEVLKQASKNGMERKWEFSCPVIEKVLRLFGGQSAICNMEEREMPTCRAQYMRMYNETIQRDEEVRKNQEVLDHLPRKQRESLSGKIVQLAEAKALREAKA